MKLLHIDSSVLGDGSASRRVTAAVVDRLRATNPGLEVVRRDLAKDPLAHYGREHLAAEHPASLGASATPEEIEARDAAERVLEEFLAADVVVIGAPLYNFTVPTQLKAWIDRILVPRRTFAYGPEGVVGLAGGKRVILAASRGGLYGPGSPFAAGEFAESYLRYVLGFIGITEPEVVVVEGLLMGPEHSEAAFGSALGKVAALTSS